jgi:hypothetical protein
MRLIRGYFVAPRESVSAQFAYWVFTQRRNTHIGTVDRVEGNRIKLTGADSGEDSHRATIIAPREAWSRAEVEGSKVRLSAKGDVAVTMEAEK